MQTSGAPQEGQFRNLQQLLETLLLSRLGMYQRGIDPEPRRLLTRPTSREELWAEAVATEILAARVLVPMAGGAQTEVPLGQLGEAAAELLASSRVCAELLCREDPGLSEAVPTSAPLAVYLHEYFRRAKEPR